MRKLSGSEMRVIDDFAVNDLGLDVEVLMENAGCQVAEVVRQEFSQNIKIGVICGKGHNSGDGLVAARRLTGWGYNVLVHTPYEKSELDEVTRKQLERVERLDDVIIEQDFPTANIYIDALLGYGIEGDPKPPVDNAIDKINKWSAETVSVDVPSGLNAEDGSLGDPVVEPEYTVCLAAVKKGMRNKNSGEIYLADIGIPVQVFQEIEIEEYEGMFKESSKVKLEEIWQ